MSGSAGIEVVDLSKRFGAVRAVRGVSFTAAPGRVTGFLGPNGSGKTTTLSMVLGLVRPDSGGATIGGTPYARLAEPGRTVGAALSASFHPGHTGRAHLEAMRLAIGLPKSRVDEMLQLVGLAGAADRRTGGYSLGMRQRLALAGAMLGDPRVLILDEPINGLDPEGIRWIRLMLRHLASEGRTVLLSSHLLSEVQQTVDDVVIIREGAIVYTGALAELQRGAGEPAVLVAADDQPALARVLTDAGAEVRGVRGETMRVTGATPAAVGRAALEAGVALSLLRAEETGLETSFLELTEANGRAGAAESGGPGEHSAPSGSDAPTESGAQGGGIA